MTEAQEKNHTDCIDLSSRMLLGQLMRRAVTYTHQAGAGGTNAPLPPEKNSRYFWVPPRICYCAHYGECLTDILFVLSLSGTEFAL